MWTEKIWAPLLAVLVAAGCGGDAGQGGEEASATSEQANPAAEASQSESGAASDRPESIADLFPEGEGRIMVLNNCTSCHAVACAAIGQRSAARWDGVRNAHSDRLPSLSEEDMQTIFTYLQENFDDTQPEPEVPAEFLQRGCTPN